MLTEWERARGTRLLAGTRERLDGEVARIEFIIEHVDFNAYVRAEARALAIRLGHYGAHLTLQAVRSVERLLTRTVRHLRSKVASEVSAPRETSRPFVQALDDFKQELRNATPEIPEL